MEPEMKEEDDINERSDEWGNEKAYRFLTYDFKIVNIIKEFWK